MYILGKKSALNIYAERSPTLPSIHNHDTYQVRQPLLTTAVARLLLLRACGCLQGSSLLGSSVTNMIII